MCFLLTGSGFLLKFNIGSPAAETPSRYTALNPIQIFKK